MPALRLAIAALVLLAAAAAGAAERSILLQSTTSTQNSGLFDYLLPRFTAASGIEVRVVAVGTGQALKNAADGNGDAVLVHARAAEEAFVAAGHGVARHPVMYNEFVLIGPASDPAGVAAADSAAEALARIAAHGAPFVSRGDDSGTHKRERELWRAAGFAPGAGEHDWYRDIGGGMGRAIAVAVEIDAYTLSDRATWIAFRARDSHRVLLEGDPALFNPYSVIMVNPARHPHVDAEAVRTFIDWLTGPTGQAAIAAFRVRGEQLFFPSATAAP